MNPAGPNLLKVSRYQDKELNRRRPDQTGASLGQGTDFQMIRILLAEDDDVMREYLARALTSAGYHVTAVDRGTAAVPYIDSGTFDLLLSDLVMPEMDGFELTEAIRTSPALRRIPVVITSTHDDHKYIFRALRLGANDYLIKPPTAEMLKIVLARIFDNEW